MPLDLLFVDCKFNLPATADVSLAATKTLTLRASDLTNQSLLRLTESPKLTGIELAGTAQEIVSSDKARKIYLGEKFRL